MFFGSREVSITVSVNNSIIGESNEYIYVLYRAVTSRHYHNINERMREYSVTVLVVVSYFVNKFSVVHILDISLHENKIYITKPYRILHLQLSAKHICNICYV